MQKIVLCPHNEKNVHKAFKRKPKQIICASVQTHPRVVGCMCGTLSSLDFECQSLKLMDQSSGVFQTKCKPLLKNYSQINTVMISDELAMFAEKLSAKFKWKGATLALAHYLYRLGLLGQKNRDQFLPNLAKFQLSVSLYLSAKYCQVKSVRLKDYLYYVNLDHLYSPEHFKEYEYFLLKACDFNLNIATVTDYADLYAACPKLLPFCLKNYFQSITFKNQVKNELRIILKSGRFLWEDPKIIIIQVYRDELAKATNEHSSNLMTMSVLPPSLQLNKRNRRLFTYHPSSQHRGAKRQSSSYNGIKFIKSNNAMISNLGQENQEGKKQNLLSSQQSISNGKFIKKKIQLLPWRICQFGKKSFVA